MRPSHFAAALLLFGVAACQPQAPDGAPAPPPADATPAAEASAAASPFEGDLDAKGTEPFWALAIRDQTLTLRRPDQPDLAVGNPGMRLNGDQAVWDSLGATGRLYVTMRQTPCSDGMSDRNYPLTVEVKVKAGDVSLKGCADKVSAATPGN